jgi:putative tricarboxylic transport membrane protein
MARKLDIGVSVVLVVLCVAVFWESLSMPPAFYDPIGPAAFPRALSVTIFFLSMVIMLHAFRMPSGESKQAAQQPTHRLRPDLAVASAVLTVVYVLLLTLRLVSFSISTTVYLILFIMLLMRFDLRRLPITIIIAMVMGLGCGYVFMHVFFIDLP